MDPQLFDLIWAGLSGSRGSNDYIHVVCGYRSPETNAMLRRRSSGVAKNSQHMLGKAMDFFIPDVPLAKLRAIGLRMQVGGVGFYPTSGSPFVHMDTGSVRMWPRMTRQQLVAVFPNGKHAATCRPTASRCRATTRRSPPTRRGNGKPADHRRVGGRRRRRRPTMCRYRASRRSTRPRRRFADPLCRGVCPRFRRSGDHSGAASRSLTPIPDVFFETAYDVSTPPVPADLATTMAARDQSVAESCGERRRSVRSLPIPPTAIVATVDVTRPLRAEAITMAVLRTTNDAEEPGMPTLLAYAPTSEPAAVLPEKPRKAKHRRAVDPDAGGQPAPRPARCSNDRRHRRRSERDLSAPRQGFDLTLTQLDTQGLRIWIADQSTREKRYALLTMPDFGQMPSLLEKPQATFAAGFTKVVYEGLRTDHFSGPLVQPPAVVDLTMTATVAAR